MKSFKNVCSLGLLLTASTLVSVAQAGNVYVPIDGTYKLTFDEEFNGTAVDTTKWGLNWLGSAGQITQPVNGSELEAYDPTQCTVSGGNLHMTAISHTVTAATNGQTYNYTSCLLNSAQGSTPFSQAYGYWEARMYLPGSSGKIANWPAFWADGTTGTWPANGEMDIMEGLNGLAQYHFHSPTTAAGGGPTTDFSGWHIFAALWQSGSVTYYYDGVAVGSLTSGITSIPMFLIVNNAVASTSVAGPLVIPADALVDYIHVYSNASGATAVTPQTGYNGPGDDGSTTTPTTNFSVTSPANNATVSGTTNITGSIGTLYVNVAAYDIDNSYAQVSLDTAPSAGAFSVSVDTTQFSNAVHHIALIAFSVPPGQSGGTSAEVDLTLTVNNTPIVTNFVLNPGFESGMTSWSSYGTTSIVSANTHSGSGAAKIVSGTAGFEQTITGLAVSTHYIMTAYVRDLSGSASQIGVKNYGGSQVTASGSGTGYHQLTVNFTTGSTNTSALVFFYNGGGSGLADDFSVTKAP